MKKQVWFITGASKGLGLVLVKKLLKEGYRVAATSRTVEQLQKEVVAAAERFLPLATDLTNEESVERAISETVAHFGRIDVLVNNAGYGLVGALEELGDDEARENFDVNVFGSLNVIRKGLPYLRKQGSGHVFNISSIGGFTGAFPGFGIYCATKFAVQGLTESLQSEIKPFGIKATVVSPGYFRTEFLASGSLSVPHNPIDAYKSVRETQSVHQDNYNGNQPGDPEKAADALITVFESAEPPLHLFLGKDAYELAEAKIGAVQSDMQNFKTISLSTGFQ